MSATMFQQQNSSNGGAPVFAITGATGMVGSRVAARLARRGVAQLLLARDPARLPELPGAVGRGPAPYGDGQAMRAALAGADTLLLVSGGLSGRRLQEHISALDAAVAAGVRRVVYLSLIGAAADAVYVNARDHFATEQYLSGLPLSGTVLRAGFYTTMLLRLADGTGEIAGPGDDGRVSFLSHDDLADVIVAVLLDEAGDRTGNPVVVTGPRSLTLGEAAARLGGMGGPSFRYRPLAADLAAQSLRREGMSEPEIANRITWFEAIAHGDAASVSDAVPLLAGHAGTRIDDDATVRAALGR